MWRERSSTSPRPPDRLARRLVPPPRGTTARRAAGERDRRGDVVGAARERDRERLDARTCSRRPRTGGACTRRRARRPRARAAARRRSTSRPPRSMNVVPSCTGGTPLPADPRADERARPGAARDRRPDDRPSRAGLRRTRPGGAGRTPRGVPDDGPGGRLPGVRAPARGRPRSSTRSRPATACWRSRPATSRRCGRRWPSGSAWRSIWVPGDWRHGVDPTSVAAVLRSDPSIARGDGRPQRDLDGRDEPRPRGPRGDRRRRLGRAAARRHDLLARLDRLSARRVGRRRDRRRLAEGPDAARPGLGFNAVSREGAGRLRTRAAAALVLGLGADHRRQRERLLALHDRRRTCSTGCARRCAMLREEGLENVFARHARHAEATRAAVARLGPGGAVRRRARALGRADRGRGAGRRRRRRRAPDHPRALRHVARRRARQARRAACSGSATSATSTT